MPRLEVPPLPREIETDPAHAAIRTRLERDARPLWPAGELLAPVLAFTPALADALGAARRAGRLVLGLEATAAALATEARGRAALARRGEVAPGARVSRLLLLSADGAERLYRHAERLAATHGSRVLVALVAIDASGLGRAATGREATVKAVLVEHKEAVATVLRALVDVRDRPERSPSSGGSPPPPRRSSPS